MTLRAAGMGGILIAVAGKTQPVRGKVLDSSGQPVFGAMVTLRRTGKSGTDIRRTAPEESSAALRDSTRFLTTGADGSFFFPDVPEGEVVVVARRGNSRPAAFPATVSAQTPLEINLTVR
jgi:hypothetical protein